MEFKYVGSLDESCKISRFWLKLENRSLALCCLWQQNERKSLTDVSHYFGDRSKVSVWLSWILLSGRLNAFISEFQFKSRAISVDGKVMDFNSRAILLCEHTAVYPSEEYEWVEMQFFSSIHLFPIAVGTMSCYLQFLPAEADLFRFLYPFPKTLV